MAAVAVQTAGFNPNRLLLLLQCFLSLWMADVAVQTAGFNPYRLLLLLQCFCLYGWQL
jgi:hypothetical protein